MRPIALGLILLVTTAAAPPVDPVVVASKAQIFFQGRTESRGELRKLLSRPHKIVAHGNGHIEPDGTLVLQQVVHEDGVEPRQRVWRLRQDRLGHCTGTVTDGVGPVTGKFTGDRLQLRFKLKGGLSVQQWLTFQPDGRSASNRISIRKFGIAVASITETIRKLD